MSSTRRDGNARALRGYNISSDQPNPGDVLTWDGALEMWVPKPPSGGGGGGNWVTEPVAVLNDGQVNFTLPSLPTSDVEMTVNGVSYFEGQDFTRVGTAVTWINPTVVIMTTDTVFFLYQDSGSGNWVTEQTVVGADGQTNFVLPSLPSSDVEMTINGVSYYEGQDFTRIATVVTWTNPIVIRTTDSVFFLYQV